MSENHDDISRRVPWVAVVLSLLAAGVGHFYCGRIGKGIPLYSAWLVVFLLLFFSAWLAPTTGVLVGLLLLPVLAVYGLYIYAALDAFDVARRIGSTYQLKDYNRSWIYALLIGMQLAIPLALTIGMREFVYEAFFMPTESMSPGLLAGDRILVNKLRGRRDYPERGDLIVFRNPKPAAGSGRIFVKRVVGVAGDRVVVKGRDVEVNGRMLVRDAVPLESLDAIRDRIGGEVLVEALGGRRYEVMYGDGPSTDSVSDEFRIVVPSRSVFVLGDNRDRSRDSRHFGPVHAGDVVGHVDYIYLPTASWTRFGAIGHR